MFICVYLCFDSCMSIRMHTHTCEIRFSQTYTNTDLNPTPNPNQNQPSAVRAEPRLRDRPSCSCRRVSKNTRETVPAPWLWRRVGEVKYVLSAPSIDVGAVLCRAHHHIARHGPSIPFARRPDRHVRGREFLFHGIVLGMLRHLPA